MSIMCDFFIILLVVVIMETVNSTCDSSTASKFAECAVNQALAGSYTNTIKCAYELYKNCREDKHIDLPNEYDITINSDWQYLRELGHNGWTVKLARYLRTECNNLEDPTDVAQCFFEQLNINSCYVAWTGGFNKGKTTILNKVCGTDYPTGYEYQGETKGFNFILQRLEQDDDDQDDDDDDYEEEEGDDELEVVHIDTPGATRSVQPKDLQDRAMTDKFVYDVLPDLADIVVVVVDILTSHEQVLILDDLMEKIVSFSSVERPKYLFIVHNFKTLTTKEAVKQYIQTDIMEAFHTTEKPRKVKKKCKGYKNRQVAYYTSLYKEKYQITHFVFAADHTEAGDYYNPIATEWLRRRTNDMPCLKKEVNVLQHFIEKLEPLLRDYFYSDKITQEMLIDPPFDPAVRLRRAARWATGGYFYGDTQLPQEIQVKLDTTNDPYKLTFEPVNIVGRDDVDGIIRLKEERDLVLCPTHKIGGTPECKPNINCNVWKKPTIWALQCKLADADFSESTSNFEQDLQKKIFVLRPEGGCELIIYGTILPPWKEYIDSYDNGTVVDNFDFLHSDSMTHGFVQKRYTMDILVCTRYREFHKINFKNGVMTVTVELNSKEEL